MRINAAVFVSSEAPRSGAITPPGLMRSVIVSVAICFSDVSARPRVFYSDRTEA